MTAQGGKRGRIGRADLLAFGIHSDRVRRLAVFAGYEWRPEEAREPTLPAQGSDERPPSSRQPSLADSLSYEPEPLAFLAPASFRRVELSGGERGPAVVFTPDWPNAPKVDPVFIPLADAAHLCRLLARFEPGQRTGRAIDETRLVRRISRAEPIARLPRRQFPCSRGIQLVADRSFRLAPFWRDQRFAFEVMNGPHVHLWRFDDIEMACVRVGEDRPSLPKPEDGPLVVFGDLGAFGGTEDRRFWRRVAQDFLRTGGEVLAIVPCSTDDIPHELAVLWSPEPWEVESSAPDLRPRRQQVDDLLALSAPLSRLEPGLLRSLRRRCTRSAPVIELLLWGDDTLASSHVGAASFEPEVIASYRDRFHSNAREDPAAAAKAWRTIREWRGQTGAEFMFEEIHDLPEDVRASIVSPDDRRYSDAFWHEIAAAAERGTLQGDAVRWLNEAGHRRPLASAKLWRDAAASRALRRAISLSGAAVERPLHVSQRGDSLCVADTSTGSTFAKVSSADGFVDIASKASLPPPFTPFRDTLSDGAPGPEMIALPTGSFLMGSPEGDKEAFGDERPQHEMDITQPFALAKYPVTFEEYDAFCDATRRKKPDDEGWGRGRRPAINVSWEDATAYCDWLSAQTGEAYRLPSEAEWEYACRGGTETRYFWGDGWDASRANAEGKIGKTTEVGAYEPNEWGLYDMHGNVWEWCGDHWSDGYKEPKTQVAFQSSTGGPSRVIRGGSWSSVARYCRAAFRYGNAPGFRFDYVSFRPARGQVRSSSKQGNAERSGLRSGEGSMAEPRPERSEGPPSRRDGESDFSSPEPIRRRVMPGGLASIPLTELPSDPFVIRTDRAELVIQRITRSDLGKWASGMGRDRFGLWADFTVDDIRQRLRWCPPGQFMMGSPADEKGYAALKAEFEWAKGREEPQTEVTFETGFWMFDTPVTQELYMAVTGDKNPSRFVSPTRPVEQVSWKDAQDFLARLNERFPHDPNKDEGRMFILPSEAQWEYACRAGTTEATWAGPMEIKGQNNALILNDIAWYGGNSGVDFELEDGQDSTGWEEKAFEHSKAGSMPVKLKRANPWGLYDTLGNVWEWCEDEWHDSHEGAFPEGLPRQASQQDGVSYRVVRGGSWHDIAWYCRAAYRFRLAPGIRSDEIGFRPARGQAKGALAGKQGNAERSGPRSGEGSMAEPTAERSEGPPSRSEGDPFFSRAGKMLGFGRDKD